MVLGHHEQRDIVAHTEDLDSQVRNLREAVEILTDQLDEQKRHLDHALTNRAIIRYDAFRDAGGEQSASFALLDQYRSGVVFSAIAARDFARIYVKHLSDGVADRDLSPEEAQAVEAAVPRPLTSGEEGPKARAGAAAREPAARRRRRGRATSAGAEAAGLLAGGDRGVRRARRGRRAAEPAQGDRPAGDGAGARTGPTTSPGNRRRAAARRRRLPPLRRRPRPRAAPSTQPAAALPASRGAASGPRTLIA